MPESTLSLQISDLASEIGQYLGFGATAANWTGWQASLPYVPSSPDTQLGQIFRVLNAGLRQFYFPRQVDGGPVAHKWSFLTPIRQLTIYATQNVYPLPDDFGGMVGEMYYSPTDNAPIGQYVKRVSQNEINRLLQFIPGLTIAPSKCAIYNQQSDGVSGQRFEVAFYPVPDQVYHLSYQCTLLPQALTAVNPFPYGGMEHAETILESCLAVAESRIQDETTGNHYGRFTDLLQASIASDVQQFGPENLGYMSDRSDMRGLYGNWGGNYPWGANEIEGVLYNGVQY